jgi:hypothetical protein
MLPELVRRGVKPDAVTDQTSAHDPINGYLPAGWTLRAMGSAPRRRPERRRARGEAVDGGACARHARVLARGVPTFDYGNNIRQMAKEAGVTDAFDFPGFVPAYVRPAVLPRHRPVPLGGAVGRPRGHFSHRRQGEGADAERGASASVARHGEGAHQVSRACRRASAGSGSATGIGWGLPSTRWWRAASSRRRS